MLATQVSTSQLSAVSSGRIAPRAAAQPVCPRAIGAAAQMKSTAFVSSTAALRAAQPAKLAVRCHSGAPIAVRSEISYIMIKPDGENI